MMDELANVEEQIILVVVQDRQLFEKSEKGKNALKERDEERVSLDPLHFWFLYSYLCSDLVKPALLDYINSFCRSTFLGLL